MLLYNVQAGENNVNWLPNLYTGTLIFAELEWTNKIFPKKKDIMH